MSVISLATAKSHLNIAATDTTHDVELQRFLDQAERAVARRTGPLVATAVTARVSGGRGGLVLPTTPVLSLTSVTPVGGTALDVAGLDQGTAGVVSYATGSTVFGATRYVVVYQAGWAADTASLPEDLQLGILELVRHLWESQRRGRGVAPEPGPGFAFPYRVQELLEPFMTPGFA